MLGFSVYTDEIGVLNLPSENLKEIRWTNRNNNDGGDDVDDITAFRALIKVDGIYYASEATYPIGNTTDWQDEAFDISTSQWIPMELCETADNMGQTIGGPRISGGCLTSMNPAGALPEGTIESAGFFFLNIFRNLAVDLTSNPSFV